MIRVNLFSKKFDTKLGESSRISIDSKEFPKPKSYEEFVSKIAKTFNLKKKDIILNAFTTDEDEMLIQDQQDLEDNQDETVEYRIILEEGASQIKTTKNVPEESKPSRAKEEKEEPNKDGDEEDNKPDDKSEEDNGEEDGIDIKLDINLDIPDKELESIINSQIKEIPPIDNDIINDDIPFNIDEYKKEMNEKCTNIKNDFNKAFDSKVNEIVSAKSSLMQKRINDSILEFSKVSINHLQKINNEASGLKEDSVTLVENTEGMNKAIEQLQSIVIAPGAGIKPKPIIEDEDKITIKFINKDITLEVKKEKAKYLEVSGIEIENIGNETYKKLFFIKDEDKSSNDICFYGNSEKRNIQQLSLNGDFEPEKKEKYTIILQIKDAKPNQTYCLIIYAKEDPKKGIISKSFKINVKIKGEEGNSQKPIVDKKDSNADEERIKLEAALKEKELKEKKELEEKKKLEEKDNNLYKELNMNEVCDINEAKNIFKDYEYDQEKIKNWIKEKKDEKVKSKAEEKYKQISASNNIEKIDKDDLIAKIINLNFDENAINEWIKERIKPEIKPQPPNPDPSPNDPRLDEMVAKFDDEYNILTIIDDDEFKAEIINLSYDESKIREYIEKKLNE